MLVISRKVYELIRFTDSRTGEQIGEIKVLRTKDGKVRLGLEFVSDISIVRGELDPKEAAVA